MAFDNLVQPNYSPEQPGGNALAALNAIRQNQILNAQAQYAPQQAQANAFLTQQQAEWTPYQYKMQALSNPALWLAAQNNPEMQNQLVQVISNPLQGLEKLPAPKTEGMLGLLWDKLTGGLGSKESNPLAQLNNSMSGNQQSVSPNAMMQNSFPTSQPLSPTNSGYSPLVPSTGGPMAAITTKGAAPYNEAVIKAGQVQRDPITGNVISAPSSKSVTALQQQISASSRAIPQLKALPDLWKPFMNVAGLVELVASKGLNAITNEKARNELGFKGDLPSQYADAKIASLTSVESYLKSIGVPVTVDVQAKLNEMVEPQKGENPKGYANRIDKETKRIINDFVTQSKEQLGGGYNVTPGQEQQESQPNQDQNEGQMPPPGNVWMVDSKGNKWAIDKANVQEALKGSKGRPPLRMVG